MSRSYDYVEIQRPLHIPQTVTLYMNSGIWGISFNGTEGDNLNFCVGPTIGPIVPRRVTFSDEEFLELPYAYKAAGKVPEGILGEKEVFILLEK